MAISRKRTPATGVQGSSKPARAERLTGGGTDGNERLTKDSFFVWVAFMAIHVIGHLPSMPAVLRADYSRYAAYDYEDLGGDVTGRAGRILALSGALVAGAVLAILVIPEFGSWLHGTGLFHHHH